MGDHGKPRNFRRRAGVFGIVLALFAAGGAAAQKRADGRSDWAYPRGVFVGTPTLEGAAARYKTTERELHEFARAAGDEVDACAAVARNADPGLALRGARFAFILTFTVAADGRVYQGEVRTLTGSAPLLPCMSALAERAGAHTFSPLPPPARKKGDGKATAAPKPEGGKEARFSFAATILTDEEAAGRGFLFLKAERAWEQALRDNRHWRACLAAADCTVVYEACEVAAVNAKYEPDYAAAARLRVKPRCLPPARPEIWSPKCEAGRCVAVRQ